MAGTSPAMTKRKNDSNPGRVDNHFGGAELIGCIGGAEGFVG